MKPITAPFDDATSRAAAFIRERLRSGNYGLACYGSDGATRVSHNKGHIFVASFIAEAMADLFDEIDRTIVLVRILSEENGGQWGFASPNSFHRDQFRVFHVDADDTAYVIRTLRRLGANRDPECLRPFYRQDARLFVTFDSAGPAELTLEPSASNNMAAHIEVNANIFLALRGTHMEGLINAPLLVSLQNAAGYWGSYFYPSPLFATTLVMGVLKDEPGYEAAKVRALEFILSAQHGDGSWGENGDPYETALAVTALATSGVARANRCAAALQHGVDHLMSTVKPDGSWSSAACIWEFHFDERDVWRAYDHHDTYITARCLTALRRASGELSPAS